MAMLDFYAEPYIDYARSADHVCLCGALAGEIMVLPPELRSRVDGFFRAHQGWLTGILKRGMERGEFELGAPASKVARLVFGALQGALLVKRTTGDASQLCDVMTVIKLQLTAGT
jgi:TetR/AcrR family transcriptional regulator, transcriptional repressor for nem operon